MRRLPTRSRPQLVRSRPLPISLNPQTISSLPRTDSCRFPLPARVMLTVNARQTVGLISSCAHGTRVVLSEGVIAAIAALKKLRPGCEGESAAGPQLFCRPFSFGCFALVGDNDGHD